MPQHAHTDIVKPAVRYSITHVLRCVCSDSRRDGVTRRRVAFVAEPVVVARAYRLTAAAVAVTVHTRQDLAVGDVLDLTRRATVAVTVDVLRADAAVVMAEIYYDCAMSNNQV